MTRKQITVLAACLMAVLVVADVAFAQGSPFGVGRPPGATSAPAATGMVGWLLAKQAEFYRTMASLVRAAKADGAAAWGLIGISFLYGIFHAAGPGHGKAVISSYLVANDETWRRGVVLSFASALVQALTAIAIVAIAAMLLGATAQAMGATVRWIEVASYALIALLGARLLWTKGRAFLAAVSAMRPAPSVSLVPAAATAGTHHQHVHVTADSHRDHAHAHHHGHHHHGHHHHGAHEHDHDRGQDHAHVHDADCGHMHGPEPSMLGGRGGWRRGLTAVFAVGLRPCSGAILVLVFALAQGLFWIGVAATLMMGIGTAVTVTAIATLAVGAKGAARSLAAGRSGYGILAVRGLEVAAAALVLAFGLLLLAGYMASERLMLA